jgi:hypothetical protein
VQAHGKDARPQDDEPRRYVRRRDTEDGMVKIEAVLHPEEAELVWAMLDHAAKQLVREPSPLPARGDSEELRIAADLTTCTDARRGTACPTGDSAEARIVADLTTCTDVRRGTACPTGDSAESSNVACTATGPAAARNEGPTSDSAEACAVACAATGPAAAGTACPTGDSAEARNVADVTSSTAVRPGTECPTDDSAEASAVACTGTGPAVARNECPTRDSAEASVVADITAGSGAYLGSGALPGRSARRRGLDLVARAGPGASAQRIAPGR